MNSKKLNEYGTTGPDFVVSIHCISKNFAAFLRALLCLVSTNAVLLLDVYQFPEEIGSEFA